MKIYISSCSVRVWSIQSDWYWKKYLIYIRLIFLTCKSCWLRTDDKWIWIQTCCCLCHDVGDAGGGGGRCRGGGADTPVCYVHDADDNETDIRLWCVLMTMSPPPSCTLQQCWFLSHEHNPPPRICSPSSCVYIYSVHSCFTTSALSNRCQTIMLHSISLCSLII